MLQMLAAAVGVHNGEIISNKFKENIHIRAASRGRGDETMRTSVIKCEKVKNVE